MKIKLTVILFLSLLLFSCGRFGNKDTKHNHRQDGRIMNHEPAFAGRRDSSETDAEELITRQGSSADDFNQSVFLGKASYKPKPVPSR